MSAGILRASKRGAPRSKLAGKSPAVARTWIRDALPSRGVTDPAKRSNFACFC